MKVFAFVLLLVAAVQSRSSDVQSLSSRASLGENPWVVHLRVAIDTSGYLESCAGSLIDARWVLTSASCLRNIRYLWVRYGAVDVYRPSLVTESTSVRIHAGYNAATGENDIALVSLNRHVLNPASENINVVSIAEAGADLPSSAKFCGYGSNANGGPGENLSCSELSLSAGANGVISAPSQASEYDLGAPLVKDGVQYGILIKPAVDDEPAVFLNPANYRDWIQSTANIVLSASSANADAAADSDDEGRKVHFVN